MDDFTPYDWKSWLYGVSPFSSACAEDFSSIFHQDHTHPSAPCLGFEEWMQLAEEPADTIMELPLSRICGDLFEDNKLPLQLNGTLESAILGQDLPPPSTSHTALEYSPQVDAAMNVATDFNITSDPQEIASSSTSITNATLPDLKNIIVQKPILDKAVERLGGGKNGVQRLWGLIQFWLKHRSFPSSLELPFLSNIATNQAAAHVGNAASFEVIGRAMNVSPTGAPITLPDESTVFGTSAMNTALAACESPTMRSSNMWESRARSRATAATTRATRKHRMACKRRYSSHHQVRSASSPSRLGFATLQANGSGHDSCQPGDYSVFQDRKRPRIFEEQSHS